MTENGNGSRVQIVRKRLADGTIKEYRYDRDSRRRRKHATGQLHALKKISDSYYDSPEFAGLSERGQKRGRYFINLVLDQLGWMTFADLADRTSRQDFYELRDLHAVFPAKADKVMNALRVLLNYSYERAMIDYNHAAGIPRLNPSTRTRADNIWTPDMRAEFLAAAKPWMQRLFNFALYSGARQADLVNLRWSMIDAGWLTFKPTKTEKATGLTVHLPVYALEPLNDLVDGLPRFDSHDFILATDYGKPLTPIHIRHEVARTKARAGMTDFDITFHDLRGTAETEMLEASCSEAEAASILGHSLVSGSGPKSYAARTKRLALNAYTKWNAALNGEGEVIELRRL